MEALPIRSPCVASRFPSFRMASWRAIAYREACEGTEMGGPVGFPKEPGEWTGSSSHPLGLDGRHLKRVPRRCSTRGRLATPGGRDGCIGRDHSDPVQGRRPPTVGNRACGDRAGLGALEAAGATGRRRGGLSRGDSSHRGRDGGPAALDPSASHLLSPPQTGSRVGQGRGVGCMPGVMPRATLAPGSHCSREGCDGRLGQWRRPSGSLGVESHQVAVALEGRGTAATPAGRGGRGHGAEP